MNPTCRSFSEANIIKIREREKYSTAKKSKRKDKTTRMLRHLFISTFQSNKKQYWVELNSRVFFQKKAFSLYQQYCPIEIFFSIRISRKAFVFFWWISYLNSWRKISHNKKNGKIPQTFKNFHILIFREFIPLCLITLQMIFLSSLYNPKILPMLFVFFNLRISKKALLYLWLWR